MALSVNHLGTPAAGPGLLDLPDEILQHVAFHFTAGQWAQGPCQANRRLLKLTLPRLQVLVA